MQKHLFILTCLLLVFLAASCSKFQKLQKTDDLNAKYDGAIAYYDKGDYYRASVLLEELIPLLRGREESEKAQFYYAYTQYHQRQLEAAAYYFKNFYTTFSRSERAEEARFMHGVSLYEASPVYNLDQSNSYAAIDVLQGFIERYPESERRIKATQMIDNMQLKLEQKAFEDASLYMDLGDYKAAVIAFDNFRKDFPDSKRNERAAFLRVKSQYKLALNSVLSKKEERLREAITLYEEFSDRFPASSFSKEGQGLYEKIRSELEKTVQ